MKKVLIVLLCGVFLFSFNLVGAQQDQERQGVNDAETGEGSQGQDQATSSGSDQEDEQGQENDSQANRGSQSGSEKSVLRRSRVADAVQSMLEVAERNQGIGDQIRNITQNQVQTQEEAEGSLEMAQQRKGFMKFLIGPDYGELKKVEENLDEHNQNLEQLKTLREDLDEGDSDLFDEQIQAMEEVKREMENELGENRSGFSLFGWLNKIFNS